MAGARAANMDLVDMADQLQRAGFCVYHVVRGEGPGERDVLWFAVFFCVFKGYHLLFNMIVLGFLIVCLGFSCDLLGFSSMFPTVSFLRRGEVPGFVHVLDDVL